MSKPTQNIDVDDEMDYNDPDITGYWQKLAPLREALGVARLRFGDTAGWVLLRHADVMMAFREDSRFSKGAALRPITFPMMGPNIQGYDGHEHTCIAASCRRPFGGRRSPATSSRSSNRSPKSWSTRSPHSGKPIS